VGEPVQAAKANELIRATARRRIERDMLDSGEGYLTVSAFRADAGVRHGQLVCAMGNDFCHGS
jgi:hypothetical protein